MKKVRTKRAEATRKRVEELEITKEKNTEEEKIVSKKRGRKSSKK